MHACEMKKEYGSLKLKSFKTGGMILKRFRKPRGEMETISSLFKKMTPDEIQSYLHERFIKDIKVFNRLVKEQEESHNWLRTQPEVRPILERVATFYADLVADGYVKKDFGLFEHDEIKDWKFAQSRAEYISTLNELDQKKNKDYSEIFRKWNRAYVNNYETIIDQYLVSPAQNIAGRKISDKTRILNTLREYRDGKHFHMFESLIPQIRNSIQHQDFIIDPKQPKITFYDKKKEHACMHLT